MICFSGERGTTRHGSTQNGIVGVQPYSLNFSNREYSSSSSSGVGIPTATHLLVNNNRNNCNNNSPIFDVVDMKRSYAEDTTKSSTTTSMPASKISHTSTTTAELSPFDTTPKQTKLSAPSLASVDLKSSNNNGTTYSECEVFLGGSCNPTSWRTDIAIPMLKKAGITYFNPQVEDWYPELIEKEHHAKHNANLLFFVIDNQTRGVAAMAEVAYLVASGKKVILVITGLKGPGQLIMDEQISQSEYEELTCGQLLLQDLVERHDIPVFNDINTALKCTAKVIHDRLRPQDLLKVATDLVQPAFNTNTNVKIWVRSNLKKTFDSLDSFQNGKITLADVANAWKLLTNGKLGPEEVLNSLNKLWTGSKDYTASLSMLETSTDRDKKETQNGHKNGKTLNYEEFCRIISKLILCHRNTHRMRLSTSKLSNTSFPKTSDNDSGNKIGRIPSPTTSDKSSEVLPLTDVYLAGPSFSVNDNDKWRTDVAIPLFKKYNLSYLDSETSSLTRKLLTPLDTKNWETSRILFFYLSESARAVEFIIQLAYYLGLKREIVVCVKNLNDNCKIEGETLTKTAVKDYNRARSYVSDMAKRDGFPVFYNLNDALDCVIDKCNHFDTTS